MKNKTDKELLLLAAKAVGVEYGDIPDINLWNPLKYDGDAFRLALSARICYGADKVTGMPRVSWVKGGQVQSVVMPEHACRLTSQPCAAEWVRREITKAAADIVEGIQHGH